MDYGYSPSREGGTMHFPSPTHPHSYRLDGAHFSHLQELRRSLSRSPSKQSRFQLRNSDTPRSPISPLAIARAFSPKPHKPTSPIATFFPESPLAQQAPAKKKFSLRRPAGPFRSSPRTRNSNSKSPRRRALADSPDGGNATPFLARPTAGMENTPARRPSAESPDTMDMDKRLEVNDKPIKFEFARRPDLSPLPPAKSSPLKRNDGLMNLSGSPGSSPMAKRRSLHGLPSLGDDFESIFDSSSSLRPCGEATSPTKFNNDANNTFSFNSSPLNATPTSPVRRATSLRRSTLSQRSSTPRKPDGEFAMPGAAASKTRNRMSLDSTMNPPAALPAQTPFRKSTFDAGRMGLPQPTPRAGPGAPHPLSYAHTPSSTSSFASGTPMAPPRASAIQWSGPAFGPPSNPGTNPLFSRSLPIGIGRPNAEDGEQSSQDSFDTPFKAVQPPPVAFSTGLLSKKNRNADEPAAGGIYVMPDTPSKRQSFPPAAADRSLNFETPLVKRSGSLFGQDARPPQHQFGTPSTPFSANVSKFSTDSFGKRPSIFGDMGSTMQRRGSFVSIDGDHDDDTQLDAQSPTANRMGDSQSSADDMPPTPTKPSGGSSRRSKESSLRRKTFRSRPSIGTDTFAIPDNDGRPTSKYSSRSNPKMVPGKDSSSDDDESKPTVDKSPSAHALDANRSRSLRHSMNIGRPLPLSRRVARSSIQSSNPKNNTKQSTAAGSLFGTPQTPANDSFGAPDASKLSISGNRRGSFPLNSSFGSCAPATPTTPRDSGYFGGVGAIPIGLTKNDVDESLSERFHEIKLLDGGEGEFSTVYRVSKPVKYSPQRSPAGSQVWVVKKSKKQYIGAGDRQKKMREVEILCALKGHEHVLGIEGHWEFNQHLYIQTEFCEGGNLRKYLDNVGYNSRLDDFRIWKILLELLSGLKSIHDAGYIHLDLKPANILIDFEGGLKIADFGLASQWPAPPGIDGEGDRHYLAPEQLSGRFDKPADIFALGMMLAEIAGNCVIPENGDYWQKLRSGEFATVLPSLTWSTESTLSRDSHGDPVPENPRPSMDGFLMSDADDEPMGAITVKQTSSPEEDLARAPSFMIDRSDPNCMDEVVYAMLHRDPDMRPTADDVLGCYGCRWVNARRRSGATVYEGNFGPSDEMLATYSNEADTNKADMNEEDMNEEDMMDMS